MKLNYSSYDFEKYGYQPPPQPSLNAGLYTGEPFAPNAPYGNTPASPDATYYTKTLLNLGNTPPPGADRQYPQPSRQGNSLTRWEGLTEYEGTRQNWGPYNSFYNNNKCQQPNSTCSCEQICPKTQTRICNLKNCDKTTKSGVSHIASNYSKHYYEAH
jgi:hypothetical protein